MGVLGFTPFLQKRFPEVIRELPERLRSLSGKTIAIDGTLITQRLHFAPMPYEHRHVLGWYRLVRELKEYGVGVICVFDGEERSHAKQRETERRRKIQRTDVARGAMEIERSRRLRRLTILLKQYRALSESAKDHTTETLQSIIATSHEQRDIRVPLQEMAFDNTVPDVLSLANKAVNPDSLPTIPRTENPAPTFPSPDSQTSTPRALQNFRDEVPNQLETPSLDKLSTAQSLETNIRTLEDVLPKYYVTVEDTQVTRPDEVYEATSGRQPTSVSSAKDNRMQTFAPQNPLPDDILPSEPVVQEIDNAAENLPQSTEPRIQSSNDVADVSNVLEDARLLDGEAMTSQGVSLTPGDETEERQDVGMNCNLTVEISEAPSEFAESVKSDSHSEQVYQETRSILSSDLDASFPDTEIVEAEPCLETISQGLLSLYQDYQESIPTFMAPPILDPPAEVGVMSEEVSVGVREQYAMSRNQVHLTLDEGNLWESLALPSASALKNMESTLTEEKLESLAQKSDIISRSYEKRNSPPTTKTYNECKLILGAMGVPCIESVGPYEAEALAASLVHHGLADYVASEDTDVLVYEAPLLRNLTNRQSPLILLSGAEVRQVLQLDRASYVDFALLLGTDFSQRIKNLGPNRAIKLIRTYGRIEKLIENEPRFIPRLSPEAYLKQVEVARLVFETLPPIPDRETLKPTESDDEAVVAILEKFGVYRAASVDWDFASALDGNYFGDDPAMA